MPHPLRLAYLRTLQAIIAVSLTLHEDDIEDDAELLWARDSLDSVRGRLEKVAGAAGIDLDGGDE